MDEATQKYYDIIREGSIQDAIEFLESNPKEEHKEIMERVLHLLSRDLEKLKKIYGRLLYQNQRKGDSNKFYGIVEEMQSRFKYEKRD